MLQILDPPVGKGPCGVVSENDTRGAPVAVGAN